ncbi:hypothetical protein D6856_13995 [Butyrivibrio sp. XB500-5]|uniref:hypothetical protein n=1 Tax=Butyrivibrio sp. XB500-5 TaxID=2364880 RepID=UPI000EA9CD54|nr:hypothetical protein [Butyrivibrio sp. XB500-5]RKM57763.1 hypothetical protein D6856_13995 [Butyrivibrio sp. XB500-5]
MPGVMEHFVDIGLTNQKGSKWEQYAHEASLIIKKHYNTIATAAAQGIIGAASNVLSNANETVNPGMLKHTDKMAGLGAGLKKAAVNASNMDSEVSRTFNVNA